jgi:hypothetical protein
MLPQKMKTATQKTTNPTSEAFPSRAFAALTLSETWMIDWAESVLSSGSAEDACVVAQVSLADYADARKRDPLFDDLCRALDQAADLRITEKLRVEAIRGDLRAQALYYARVRELVFPDDGQPAESPLSAAVAEAMIRAGLIAAEAANATPPASPPRPPERLAIKPPVNSRT